MKMKNTEINPTALILGCLVVAAGCTNTSNSAVGNSSTDTNALMVQTRSTNSPDADNSGKNNRDSSGSSLTSTDQGNSPADRDLTQRIRQSLVADTNYSMTAENIKIITVNGKVTLRGPVNSDAEKSGAEALAKSIAGDGNVDDQLEIKSNP